MRQVNIQHYLNLIKRHLLEDEIFVPGSAENPVTKLDLAAERLQLERIYGYEAVSAEFKRHFSLVRLGLTGEFEQLLIADEAKRPQRLSGLGNYRDLGDGIGC